MIAIGYLHLKHLPPPYLTIGNFKPNKHNIETHISAAVQKISTKFGTVTQFETRDVSDH